MTVAAIATKIEIEPRFEANRCDCCGYLSDITGTCFRCLDWAKWVYRKAQMFADIRAMHIQQESDEYETTRSVPRNIFQSG